MDSRDLLPAIVELVEAADAHVELVSQVERTKKALCALKIDAR